MTPADSSYEYVDNSNAGEGGERFEVGIAKLTFSKNTIYSNFN